MTAPDAASALLRLPPRIGWREALSGSFRLAPVILALVAIWIFFSFQSPAFMTPRNLNFLALQVSVTALLALALAFVLIIGEIDLSVAIQSSVSAAVGASLIVNHGAPVLLGALASVATALCIGVFHALLINKLRVVSFIVTLATMIFMQGVLILLMPRESRSINLVGTPLAEMSTTYLTLLQSLAVLALSVTLVVAFRVRALATGRKLGQTVSATREVVLPAAVLALAGIAAVLVFDAYKGVPLFAIVVLAAYAIGAFIMEKTALGAHLYAVGGNPEAARRAGISLERTKLFAFLLTSGFAAIAGLVSAARVFGVQFNSGGPTDMLNAVAACIIGGIALSGGRGSIWGILIGALVMASVSNGLFLNSAPDWFQYMVQGIILVIALAIDAFASGGKRR